jgi:hypothetical protein
MKEFLASLTALKDPRSLPMGYQTEGRTIKQECTNIFRNLPASKQQGLRIDDNDRVGHPWVERFNSYYELQI